VLATRVNVVLGPWNCIVEKSSVVGSFAIQRECITYYYFYSIQQQQQQQQQQEQPTPPSIYTFIHFTLCTVFTTT